MGGGCASLAVDIGQTSKRTACSSQAAVGVLPRWHGGHAGLPSFPNSSQWCAFLFAQFSPTSSRIGFRHATMRCYAVSTDVEHLGFSLGFARARFSLTSSSRSARLV